MKKIAVFDIDGTIFRSSLTIELTEALIHHKIFKKKTRAVYLKAYRRWIERKGTYDAYIAAVVRAFELNIRGVRYTDFLKVAREVILSHQNRVYRYTRDLVKDLHKKQYYIIAISNSPRDIVTAFCNKLGFNKVYGRIYKTDKGKRFTGEVEFVNLISDKAKILRRAVAKEGLSLTGSVGVGDTESDIAFLKLVEKPICFNPNQKLLSYAKRKKWQVAVERKDVIYHIGSF